MNLNTMEHLSEHCRALAHPAIFNFCLSLFLVFGILGSYLPQHVKLIQRRSSEGLSPYFILLGTMSSTFAIANVLVLPTSHQDIGCCKSIGAFPCVAGLLGIAQIGVQWSCFFAIMFMFILFFPRDAASANGNSTSHSHHPHALDNTGKLSDPYSYRTAILVVGTCMLHILIMFVISIAVVGAYPDARQSWADTCGILASLLACIQYLPQIYTTWKLKSAHSLSIMMMCFQTPGSAVFVLSLALRFGRKGWSAWAPYVVTGILQGVLLTMAIVFDLRDRRRGSEESAIGESLDRHEEETDDENGFVYRQPRGPLRTASERTALLPKRSGSNSSTRANRGGPRRTLSARKLSTTNQVLR